MKYYEEWEFNVAGIYNYKRKGYLDAYFSYVKENHEKIDGDIIEAGVWRGASLLGMAAMLKELGSSKKVFGYDTFKGFPPVYHFTDKIEHFEVMAEKGEISKEHLAKVKHNVSMRSLSLNINSAKVDAENISLSADFSDNNKDLILRKCDFFGLDNVVLVEGAFSDTMIQENMNMKIMAGMLDCDLYHSYHTCFNFIWPQLSDKGIIYLDEYYSLKFPGAKAATDEFFNNKDSKPQKHPELLGDFERWFVKK